MRDYLALLRRQRWLVLAVTLVFAAVAYGFSQSQEKRYSATASISFRDFAEDLPLIGGQGLRELAPAERAARNAELISGTEMARTVRNKLKTELSPEALSGGVTPRVAVTTNLVEIEANWGDPAFAASLANAFARAAVSRAIRDDRERLDNAIDGLQDRLKDQDEDSLVGQLSLSQLSQIQALQEIVKPAEVAQPAEVPGSPVSPKPVRNGILGGLVGLAFGLIVAFIRDSLDRHIRTPHDAHEELGFPVLGRIGLSALGSAGLANGQFPLTEQDRESFRMLRTNLAYFEPGQPLRTVLVTSGLAQEGKSTVAAAVASAAAAAGQRTLLVDCDLRRPTLAQRLNLKPEPGLAEYLAGEASPNDVLQVLSVSVNGTDGQMTQQANDENPISGKALVCIAAGSPPSQPAELLASERCRDFFAKVAKAYDLVVIDSSPMLASVDPLTLLPHVDGVLLCVRVGESTRDEAGAVKQAMARLPERPTGVVVTGLHPGSGDDYGYYGYHYTS
ncbi:MAG: AAA family ATPase [Actinomycetota bacterium]|nr:AAA family ATPase [Actinomycetota bacterium]